MFSPDAFLNCMHLILQAALDTPGSTWYSRQHLILQAAKASAVFSVLSVVLWAYLLIYINCFTIIQAANQHSRHIESLPITFQTSLKQHSSHLHLVYEVLHLKAAFLHLFLQKFPIQIDVSQNGILQHFYLLVPAVPLSIYPYVSPHHGLGLLIVKSELFLLCQLLFQPNYFQLGYCLYFGQFRLQRVQFLRIVKLLFPIVFEIAGQIFADHWIKVAVIGIVSILFTLIGIDSASSRMESQEGMHLSLIMIESQVLAVPVGLRSWIEYIVLLVLDRITELG